MSRSFSRCLRQPDLGICASLKPANHILYLTLPSTAQYICKPSCPVYQRQATKERVRANHWDANLPQQPMICFSSELCELLKMHVWICCGQKSWTPVYITTIKILKPKISFPCICFKYVYFPSRNSVTVRLIRLLCSLPTPAYNILRYLLKDWERKPLKCLHFFKVSSKQPWW